MPSAERTTSKQEVKASAREIHISPRKVRLVVSLVKGLPALSAVTKLTFVTKKAAQPLTKLINSAVANAEHNFQIAPERLYIKELFVDGGRVSTRYQPRAQGRAFPVRRRTSNINLVLGVSEKPLVEVRKEKPKGSAKAEVRRGETYAKPAESVKAEKPETAARQKRWFQFWRREKERGGALKEDVKGKKQQQIIDRRGQM